MKMVMLYKLESLMGFVLVLFKVGSGYISSWLEPRALNWYTGNTLPDRYAKSKF